MTLQQLKYFIITANSGSISKAAEKLFIAQPSLSNALRDLEAETGRRLLSRTPKGTIAHIEFQLNHASFHIITVPGRERPDASQKTVRYGRYEVGAVCGWTKNAYPSR